MNKEIIIIAGEESGDMHGAALMRELKSISPELRFTGIGGNRMKNEGMSQLFHISQMSFLGFAEVVRHLPFISRVKERLIDVVKTSDIKTAILIDYPGFNLNIAKKLKSLDVKIFYYISPQVWAWGKNRVEKMRTLIDELIVILPFEEKFFQQHGINAHYVGNPLVERIKEYKFLEKEILIERFGLDKQKEILLVLPGSRNQEIKKIFSETISAAGKISREFNMQIVVACSENIDDSLFNSLNPGSVEYRVIKGHTYDLFRYSSLGIIKSGTSTLEAGLFNLPMIVVYVTNPLTYYLGRILLNIKMIALVNIVLGEKVVTELIQSEVSKERIYSECKMILSDKGRIRKILENYQILHKNLGDENASKKAAEIICKNL